MHHKNIKYQIRKQLKDEYPHWHKLSGKEKKDIAQMVLAEAVKDYDFNQDIQTITASEAELLGIEEQTSAQGIMNLTQMAKYLDDRASSQIIHFPRSASCSRYIEDPELKMIDELLDNEILNDLFSYEGYSPTMREYFPSQMFKAELLKNLKYSEISYRKYSSPEYMGKDRKENRAFIGLPIGKNNIIDHTQLSQFRKQATYSQMLNVFVYILHIFYKSGILSDCIIHGVDSTELDNDCRVPLASLFINGKKIKIYRDLDCDCGARRNKRDKSAWVVGYRMHTLTAIDTKTGHSYPLLSLLAPANHHDSNYLTHLVALAQAIGIEVALITADEAYGDTDGSLLQKTGAQVITPVHAKYTIPENVDPKTHAVFHNEMCEKPMEYQGCENNEHEFSCTALPGECPFKQVCSQCRMIPVDARVFQRMPHVINQVSNGIEIRKNCERAFNLMKNREGLLPMRVRSQHGLLIRSVITNIATLLIEICKTRKKVKTVKKQLNLLVAAA